MKNVDVGPKSFTKSNSPAPDENFIISFNYRTYMGVFYFIGKKGL